MNSKTTFKKGLCGLVLLLFSLSVSFVISNHVCAEESDFVVDENGVLTNYKGSDTDLVIPEKINGITITSIGDKAFYCFSNLTSIEIPKSVTSIGDSAFFDCSDLTTINIPKGVTSIDDYAFRNCSGLTSLDIPNSVTSIGAFAFSSCFNLTSINIPKGVTSINDGTFGGCHNLISINIPDSVTSIGENAFDGCFMFTLIDIPDSVTSINNFTFRNCFNLREINIPDSVTSIGENAFDGCYMLTSINIPDSVTFIGKNAFCGCSGLTSIDIPKGVTSIGDSAFYNCYGLTSLDIHKGVTSIGDYAFYHCFGLTSLDIPKSVITLGSNVFWSCDRLRTIVINNDTITIGSNLAMPNYVTLFGNKNSATEQYAKDNKYKFRLIGEIPLTGISLKKTLINLQVEKSALNSVIYNPEDTTDDKSVTWTSSNKDIATVTSKGKITGVSSGSAIITAKVGTLKATCKVTVKDDNKPTDNKIYFTDDYEGKTVTKDETIRIPVKLSTIKDYYALDSSIKYDKTKLEFTGYSIKENYKDCYADSSDVDMLRFILASKGKKYPINTSDDPIIYLNFKCIATGDADVTITSTTLANLNEEVTVKADNLDKTTIHITGTTKPTDINRDGKFSLIDLAIDAYYYGVDANETDKTKYDADIIPDGKIDDLDLIEITKNIINNK